MGRISCLKFGLVSVLALMVWQCDTADPEPPAPASPITVLQPKAGARAKVSDTIKIITESDYSKFAGNLSAVYSADSGKKYDLILSAPHNKTGIARDTFPFIAGDFGLAAGQKVKLQVWEYGVGGIRVDIGFVHLD